MAHQDASPPEPTEEAITTPHFSPAAPLGRTGFRATRLGAGDLADPGLPFETCVATLRRALDAGLNVVDTAPGYEDGLGERIVGAALRGRPRREIFVIDKIDALDAPVAPQVEASLGRLGLRQVDLFAFHDVSLVSQWEALAAPGGGFEELEGVVRAGGARFRGISSHHPDVLARAIPSGLCDVVMFPIGPVVDPRYVSEILPLARQHGVGVVSFKTFGAGKLLGDSSGYGRPLPAGTPGGRPRLSVDECVRYTLSCGPDVALLGLSTPDEQDAAFAAAAAFRALAPDEREEVRRRAEAAIAGKGPRWWDPAPAA
jgi:aryl-alcohol dehydrogenase-like predicted oxidoreductase